MDFLLLAFPIVWYSSICLNDCHGIDTTTLSPQNVESAENTNLTLVCSYDGQYVGSFQQGSFRWIQNTKFNPTYSITPNGDCNVRAGWLSNSLLYSYKCINDTSHSITLLNIKQQQDGETYQCRPEISTLQLPLSNIVTLRITVAVKVAAISPYTNMLTIVENGTSELFCTSSPCQPKPKFRWYITNNNNPDGSVSILIESAPIESEAGAIQSYTHRFGINPKRTWNDRFLFCGASNSDVDFILSAKILINVTYPPDGPPRIEPFENPRELKIFEYGIVSLKCISTGGNPRPRLEWNKNNELPQIVSGSTVSKNITWQAINKNKEELRCESIHSLSRYTSFVYVNVLYPPETPAIKIMTSPGVYVQVYKTLHIIEGLPFTLNCSADSNPPVSLFQWNNLMPTDSSIFYVANADRRNAEAIACKVSNTMQTSDSSTSITGNNGTSVEVKVLYPPTMNIAREATIIEGDNLDNVCNFTRGNPPDTNITWSWKGRTWNANPQQPYIVSRNQSGQYMCSVRNFMASSDGTRVFGNARGEFNLSVQCKPRKSPFINILDTVKSPTLVHVTLSFTAMAYPVPAESGYVWTRQGETPDMWVNISSSGNKTNISTRGLQSNLTIKDISQFDYGMYRLFIFNDVGEYNHTFTLVPAVYENDGSSAASSNVSVVAASVAVTVIGVVIVVAVIIIMLYRKRKNLSYQKRECSMQYYNVSDSKVAELNVETQVDNANAYEAFQSTGSDQQYDSLSQDDCKEKNDGDGNMSAKNRSLNVYEGLRNTGFDQQYEQISPIASHVEKEGQPMVYENLQLTRKSQNSHDAN